MKNKIFFIILIGIIVFSCFVLAEGEDSVYLSKDNSNTDISTIFDGGKVIGDEVVFIPQNKTIFFMFDTSSLSVKQGDNLRTFENIQPNSKSTPAFFKFDDYGNIISADFTTNDEGGVYYFDNDKIIVPPNSRLQFSRLEGLILTIPEGETLQKLPEFDEEIRNSKNKIRIFSKNLRLPGGYVLDLGELLCVQGNCYIEGGKKASISGYSISANKGKNVQLFFGGSSERKVTNFNYVRFGEEDLENTIFMSGSDFDVSFNVDGSSGTDALQVPISLARAKNQNKYFGVGDSGDDVKIIQRIVGLTGENVDGVYGELTRRAVLNWQKKNFPGDSTQQDGLFGPNSLKKVYGFSGSTSFVSKISLKNGFASFHNSQQGLSFDAMGGVILNLGNTKYTYNGKTLSQRLISSNAPTIGIPIKLNLYNEKGKLVRTVPVNKLTVLDSTLPARFTEADRQKAAGGLGITTDTNKCATFVTMTVDQLGGRSGRGNALVTDLGVVGSAWEMEANILAAGGTNIYNRYALLTTEQQQEFQVKIQEFKVRLAQEGPAAVKHDLQKFMSDTFGGGAETFTSQQNIQEGDVISILNPTSNYYVNNIREATNNQYNTHVGIVTGFSDTQLTFDSAGEISLEAMKKQLGYNDDSSLYLNRYFYTNEAGQSVPISLNGGKFYSTDGTEFVSSGNVQLLVKSPILSHMITTGGNAFQTISLPSFVDSSHSKDKDYSIYAVTRPAYDTPSASRSLQDLDVIDLSATGINCEVVDCSGLDLTQKLSLSGVPEAADWASIITSSTLQRKEEYQLPDSQLNAFSSMTAAIISRESQFGDSELYKFKKYSSYVHQYKSYGYMQVNGARANELANDYRENPDNLDLFDPETNVRYGQRILADLFKFYAPQDGPPTDEQLELIASAYNSGKFSPRNAGLQMTLIALGYLDENSAADGLLGANSQASMLQFAVDNGLTLTPEDVRVIATRPGSLEQNELYKKIIQEYKTRYGTDPPYAIVPERSHTDSRGRTTVAGYSNNVVRSTKKFST